MDITQTMAEWILQRDVQVNPVTQRLEIEYAMETSKVLSEEQLDAVYGIKESATEAKVVMDCAALTLEWLATEETTLMNTVRDMVEEVAKLKKGQSIDSVKLGNFLSDLLDKMDKNVQDIESVSVRVEDALDNIQEVEDAVVFIQKEFK